MNSQVSKMALSETGDILAFGDLEGMIKIEI